ncbi:unnamed protein product [Moneuplotes crassus]|uniref:Uncharacterized protein n=1 Tax=Euplotes crassus TaxID=5936 RepID=A0AAD1UCD2_EUPCR|nr:unnamed protein product [Moneuplotes crassus]
MQKIQEMKLKEKVLLKGSTRYKNNETIHQRVKKYFKMLCPHRENFSISKALQSQRNEISEYSKGEYSHDEGNPSWKNNTSLRNGRSYFLRARKFSQPENSSKRSMRSLSDKSNSVKKIVPSTITQCGAPSSKANSKGFSKKPNKARRITNISTDKTVYPLNQRFKSVAPASKNKNPNLIGKRRIVFRKNKKSHEKLPKISLQKESKLNQSDSLVISPAEKLDYNDSDFEIKKIKPIKEERLRESTEKSLSAPMLLKEPDKKPAENKMKNILDRLFAKNYETGEKSDVGSYEESRRRSNPSYSQTGGSRAGSKSNLRKPSINILISNSRQKGTRMDGIGSLELGRKYTSAFNTPAKISSTKDKYAYHHKRTILNPNLVLKKSKKSELAINDVGILKYLNKDQK